MRLLSTNNVPLASPQTPSKCQHQRERTGGFSLVELLIVVALSMVLISFGIAWLNSERSHVTRTQLVATQALEMATLNRALESYIQTASTLPTNGSTATVALSDLVTAKLIPAQYASRPKTGMPPPVSPLGQRYVMKAAYIHGGFKGAVIPEGPLQVGAAARAGGNDTPEWLESFNAGVMKELRTEHYSAAAFVRDGSTASDLDATGFDLDLAPFVTSAARSSIVALAGYQELQPKPAIAVEVEIPAGGGACYHWVKREQVFSTAGNHSFVPNAALIASGGNVTVRAVGGGGPGFPTWIGDKGPGGGGSGADITRVFTGILTPRPIQVGRAFGHPAPGGDTSFGTSLLIAKGGHPGDYYSAGAAGGEGGLPGEMGGFGNNMNARGDFGAGGKQGAPGGGGRGMSTGTHGMVVVSWEEKVDC